MIDRIKRLAENLEVFNFADIQGAMDLINAEPGDGYGEEQEPDDPETPPPGQGDITLKSQIGNNVVSLLFFLILQPGVFSSPGVLHRCVHALVPFSMIIQIAQMRQS